MVSPPIGVLTDFGTADAYVGVMKAVIASITPEAPIVDITHAVPPGDVHQGAFLLWQAAPYFPSGSILLAVVDPGVGTPRRGVALAFEDFLCVGPDNGLFTYLLSTRRCLQAFELRSEELRLAHISATFHGRDVFAPAAAHLARGIPIRQFGPVAHNLKMLPLPKLRMVDGPGLEGEVIHIDHFGNAVTSIGGLQAEAAAIHFAPWLPGGEARTIARRGLGVHLPGGRQLPLCRTFADVQPGEPLAYIGSSGLLELAIHGGRAADALGLARGLPITLGYERSAET